VAFLYGPLVLAGDLGKQGLENAGRYGPMAPQMEQASAARIPLFQCNADEVLAKLIPEPGARASFRTVGAGVPGDILLAPFYKVVEPRYTVYWKLRPPAESDNEKSAGDGQ
jgi:hypothetical protein